MNLFLKRTAAFASLLLLPAGTFAADDPIFSGPQVGEKTTGFKSVEIVGQSAGKEHDVIKDNDGKATALVFVHGLERSMLPLMRVVDNYGDKFKDKMSTEFVFLSESRVDGMQRFARALNSIRLKGRSTLSIDGAEGPGNYGLNKECLLTIIGAKDNRVHANFAGGGVKGGQVIGATDNYGETPAERPIRPEDVATTLLAMLGIDPQQEYQTPTGRPIKLQAEGSFIRELV
ncbi:MAG: hypothetical protein CMO80_14925 [Verrucomicrobiales bacterium]|nr:hypothetical protein [Verrucomicrobiales bacterium]